MANHLQKFPGITYAQLRQSSNGHPPASLTTTEWLWKLAGRRASMAVGCVMLLLLVCASILFCNSSVSTAYEAAEEYTEVNHVAPMPAVTPSFSSFSSTKPPPPSSNKPLRPGDVKSLIDYSVGGCNIWRGEWIPNPKGPTYNNSCWYITEPQDCIKNGRPDHGYLYWRWKPHDCELPLFNAKAFLKHVRGKSWAFIGDSINGNHFVSILCSLAQAEIPEDIHNDGVYRNANWYFKSYDFTLTFLWAPFLVQANETEEKLYLDKVDERWAPLVHKYDYILLSSGQWYFKPSVYFMGGKVVGCFYCPGTNMTDIGFAYAYREALRTVFDFLIEAKYKGVVFLRTFAPDHFEHGKWHNGGNCTRTAPFRSNSTSLQGATQDMYNIQLEELGKTMQRRSEFKFTLKIADTIHAALLRPDGHPGPYRTFEPFAHVDEHAKVQNDCLHWCLPGAVDAWSAMILEVLRHM